MDERQRNNVTRTNGLCNARACKRRLIQIHCGRGIKLLECEITKKHGYHTQTMDIGRPPYDITLQIVNS